MNTKLIFIYNAKEDILSKAVDFTHKILSPSTYACELCAITYGNFTIHNTWKKYLDELPVEKIFYYREKWQSSDLYSEIPLPAILLKQEQEVKVLLSKNDFNKIHDVDALIKEIDHKLKDHI